MELPEVARAVTAAAAVASSLGLPADDGVVLHNSNKLALRLTPCDVLARVTRSAEEAQLELERARRLAEAGCPVAGLEPRVDPVVHRHDGLAVTLWTYHLPTTPTLPPADYAAALQRLHAGMRQVAMPSPRFTDRIAEAERIVGDPVLSPDLRDRDRTLLGGRLEELHRRIGGAGAPEQLLHGEPHPGNLLATRHGPLFIDFETCCRGPVEFDLAHVPEAVSEHYPDVDRRLVEDCRQLVLAMVAAWRWRLGDEFPDGRRWAERLLGTLRAGPPWPALDSMTRAPAAGPS